MSKCDQEIADYFNGLLSVITKQSEQLEKQSQQINMQSERIQKQGQQIDKLEKKIMNLNANLVRIAIIVANHLQEMVS